MAVSYRKLFELLSDNHIKKGDLVARSGIAHSTLIKLKKNENVAVVVLDKICNALGCEIGDIMEVIPEADGREPLLQAHKEFHAEKKQDTLVATPKKNMVRLSDVIGPVIDEIEEEIIAPEAEVIDVPAVMDELPGQERKMWMIDHLESLSADDLSYCFKQLKGCYVDLINRRFSHIAWLPYSEEHVKLAERLCETGYIGSFEVQERKTYDQVSGTRKVSKSICCKVKGI